MSDFKTVIEVRDANWLFHIQNSFTLFSSREENEGQDKTDAGDKQLCTHGLSRGLDGGGSGWRCR